ncbi:MAG: hypothetical protein LBM97_00300 [Candidatus Nomurabacteria bacterium]|jgi:hypothetical protein|nr:hypothetical protein [Candidatus Nomurabacteria bacterium]
MKKLVTFGFILSIFGILVAPPLKAHAATAPPNLLLTEIHVDPTDSTKSYIEVFNNSSRSNFLTTINFEYSTLTDCDPMGYECEESEHVIANYSSDWRNTVDRKTNNDIYLNPGEYYILYTPITFPFVIHTLLAPSISTSSPYGGYKFGLDSGNNNGSYLCAASLAPDQSCTIDVDHFYASGWDFMHFVVATPSPSSGISTYNTGLTLSKTTLVTTDAFQIIGTPPDEDEPSDEGLDEGLDNQEPTDKDNNEDNDEPNKEPTDEQSESEDNKQEELEEEEYVEEIKQDEIEEEMKEENQIDLSPSDTAKGSTDETTDETIVEPTTEIATTETTHEIAAQTIETENRAPEQIPVPISIQQLPNNEPAQEVPTETPDYQPPTTGEITSPTPEKTKNHTATIALWSILLAILTISPFLLIRLHKNYKNAKL